MCQKGSKVDGLKSDLDKKPHWRRSVVWMTTENVAMISGWSLTFPKIWLDVFDMKCNVGSGDFDLQVPQVGEEVGHNHPEHAIKFDV